MRADQNGFIAMHATHACDELETWANDLEDDLHPADRTIGEDEMVRWYPHQQRLLRATQQRILEIVGRLRENVLTPLEAQESD